ncbi:MAG: hypothetical protein CND66_00790 [Marine Group II euryarchaeote MED-G37]|nr:MAG: hypothetical protein CND66_00790 [Marine Group II euryarchaeote MED-G37]
MLLSWEVINLGLLNKIRSENEDTEDSDAATERAHEILQIVGERVEKVRPSRVIFASVAVLLILSGIMIIGTWIVPYDRTSVDVVYLQGVGGHVVLAELDNKGSRSITDVQLDIRFLDDDSNEIARSTFQTDEIAAHTSIAGDNLELIAPGASVWENYTIEIILDYAYRGTEYNERWTYNVGSWTMETFTYEAPMHFL